MIATIAGVLLIVALVIVAVRSGSGQRSRGRDDGSWKRWGGGW